METRNSEGGTWKPGNAELRNLELKTTYLPRDYQPLTRLFSLLASYFAAHHTYFTDCETKNTVRAGFTKRNVNTLIPLACN